MKFTKEIREVIAGGLAHGLVPLELGGESFLSNFITSITWIVAYYDGPESAIEFARDLLKATEVEMSKEGEIMLLEVIQQGIAIKRGGEH